MITIVEPVAYVDRLWGKQRICKGETYRLMQYVLRLDHEDKVLLHNVVTGQLVILDQEEQKMIDMLPAAYSPEMESLVAKHYLVPEGSDEHQQVKNMRDILRKLDEVQGEKPILHYTILPTTACNARCYYCFEQGIKSTSMTEQTADEVVEFIASHCGKDKTVTITWFGGEPTVAETRIDQICKGLLEKGVKYRSKMTTNGYLFDQEMVAKAKSLWHLYSLQICVDGTETSYNRIKNYVSAKDNPYQRVMRNIGLLLDQEIGVGLRMNFDLGNYQEFEDVVNDALKRFGKNKFLSVGAHPVIGEYPDCNGEIHHGDDDWFMDAVVEMDDITEKNGVGPPLPRLPFLNGDSCSASTGYSLTIRPDGGISRCAELFGDDQLVGTIKDGITNKTHDDTWRKTADYEMCQQCVLYPHCLRVANCPNKTYCHKTKIYLKHYMEVMRKACINFNKPNEQGGKDNEHAGT